MLCNLYNSRVARPTAGHAGRNVCRANVSPGGAWRRLVAAKLSTRGAVYGPNVSQAPLGSRAEAETRRRDCERMFMDSVGIPSIHGGEDAKW